MADYAFGSIRPTVLSAGAAEPVASKTESLSANYSRQANDRGAVTRMGGVDFLLAIRRPRRAKRAALDPYQSSRILGRYPSNRFDWSRWRVFCRCWNGGMRRLHQSSICRSEHWLDALRRIASLLVRVNFFIDLSGYRRCKETFA